MENGRCPRCFEMDERAARMFEDLERKHTISPTERDDLLDIILGLVEQYMSDGDGLIRHEFMSCQEAALNVLKRHGLIESVGNEKYQVVS